MKRQASGASLYC